MLGDKSYPGVTAPLSLAESSENDKKLDNTLKTTLSQFNLFESKEMTLLRQVFLNLSPSCQLTLLSQTVLKKLDEMTKTFVYNVSLRRGLSPVAARKAGGKILTFGSYRLGVHAAGADIDTLCVFPRHVTREDFFEEMYAMLQNQRGVTDLNSKRNFFSYRINNKQQAVTTSFVPVVKFKFFGIPIDLLCARLVLPSVPENLGVNDPALLQNLDERCIRSLNGSRVAAEILELVPDVNVFRTALRCIKLWATKRAVYSNVLGFLGGVAWALLVARICQLYPNACASTIVSKFFAIFAGWGWPNPVILKNIEEGSIRTTLKPWNPKLNPMDRGHLMPIITPAYPSMCATHNVTSSTFKIVLGEFKKAARIIDKIMVGVAPWTSLFEEQSFFSIYRHYLQIIVSSDDLDRQRKWAGWVESRLRRLLLMLESVDAIALVHPCVDSFDTESFCINDAEVQDVVHGKAKLTESETMQRKQTGRCGRTIYTRTFYVGLFIKFNPGQRKGNSVDLNYPINRFKESVEQWQEYDERHVGIFIQPVKRSMLPPEVTNKTASVKRQFESATSEMESKNATKKLKLQAASLETRDSGADSDTISRKHLSPVISGIQRVPPSSEQPLPSFSLGSY
ncbi:polynucleotide adenylyltransferase [Apophysomyces ossiformis]|uniref:Poly(A) polymerase n=1 Tax=Apophysomyces ossiformis TaxID=679940 RepID=A0A8H7BK19_9FUNG|nr:polynucleotide adenylyltransferase [Apophysomyces ossiformis]